MESSHTSHVLHSSFSTITVIVTNIGTMGIKVNMMFLLPPPTCSKKAIMSFLLIVNFQDYSHLHLYHFLHNSCSEHRTSLALIFGPSHHVFRLADYTFNHLDTRSELIVIWYSCIPDSALLHKSSTFTSCQFPISRVVVVTPHWTFAVPGRRTVKV